MRLLVTLATMLLATGPQPRWMSQVRYEYSRRLRCILFGVLAALLTGCATQKLYYDIELTETERPAQASERYGNQKITTIQERGVTKCVFEDEMIKAVWMIPTPFGVSLVLTNKTNHSIMIIWDESAFVDENRVSHRALHSGIKYRNHDNPQSPSVVAQNGTIQDLIIPADRIHYVGGQKYGGWALYPLFTTLTAEESGTKGTHYIKKTIQVLLALQIEDVVNKYIFTFDVKNVEIK